MKSRDWVKIGQKFKPADGGGYRGVIVYVNEADDTVRHVSVFTGKEFEFRGYTDFVARYRPTRT